MHRHHHPSIIASLLLALLASACLPGETVDEEEESARACAPPGYGSLDTEIYIGEGACSDVTLQRIDNDGKPAWHVRVGYPMWGDDTPLTFYNESTGDHENEWNYVGDPEFTLYAGAYDGGGLEVQEGRNEIRYETFGDDDTKKEGAFTVTVQLER